MVAPTILKTAYYNSGALTHSALVQETEYLSHTFNHQFFEPARVVITLNDDDGSILQKYGTKTNEVYVFSGRAYLEVDSVAKFDGRIVKVEGDMNNNRVTIYAEDWWSQHKKERIDYDMREPIDGVDLRQSEFHSDLSVQLYPDDREPVETETFGYFAFDGDQDWDIDQFNDMFIVLPIDNVGPQTIGMGPSGVSLSGVLDDSPTFFESRFCWTDDTNAMIASDDTAGSYRVYLEFKPIVTEGSLHSETTGARLKLTYSLEDANGNGTLQARDTNEATFYPLGTLVNATTETILTSTFELPITLLDDILETDGTVQFAFFVNVSGGTQAILRVYYAWFEIDVVTEDNPNVIEIIRTRKQIEDMDAAFRFENGVGYTDETVDMGDSGANDVQLLPNPISQNDAFYFGFSEKTNGLRLVIGQSGVYSGTLAWQYYNGASWANLSSVTDGTSQFEAAPGIYEVTWTTPSDWETVNVDGTTKYWIRANMITAVPSMTTTPLATQGWGFTGPGTVLEVDTDLDVSGLGLWEGAKYAVAQEIHKHINGLIIDGDDLMTMTTLVEATTRINTRHYMERNRYEIIVDNARMDKAVCWVPAGTKQLVYKSTFNDGSPAAMTDEDVLYWLSEYAGNLMRNEAHVRGIRKGDIQVEVDTEDLGVDPGSDSKLKYGLPVTQVVTNTGTMSYTDAVTLGTNLVERDEDIHLFLDAVIDGRPTHELGDEVSITSTYLGLTAQVYVVTHVSYDEKTWRTKLKLHPRVSNGFVNRVVFGEFIRDLADRTNKAVIDTFIAGLTSQEWTND